MKNKLIIASLALVCSASISALAEPVKLSRAAASELYVALATTEAGLTPGNTVIVADDINALRPLVEALDKGKQAYQRSLRLLVKSGAPDAETKAQSLADEIEASAAQEVSIELTPLALTDEEITAAKLKPAALAAIRRFLLKKSTPETK